MLSQRILTRNPKVDAYLDAVEMITGLSLAGFLWAHMLFVFTIVLGQEAFDGLSEFFDIYLLSYIGVPVIIVIGLIHFVVAGRRIPTNIKDQKIIWQHAKLIRHTDTWTWIFQAISGMAILILGALHIWTITTGWPIRADVATERIQAFWWFYLILLALGEFHASIGVYRVFVKWGWFPRKPINYVLKVVTLTIITLGLVAMWVFFKLGGAA
jgi:fumarate reductase subunit C